MQLQLHADKCIVINKWTIEIFHNSLRVSVCVYVSNIYLKLKVAEESEEPNQICTILTTTNYTISAEQQLANTLHKTQNVVRSHCV